MRQKLYVIMENERNYFQQVIKLEEEEKGIWREKKNPLKSFQALDSYRWGDIYNDKKKKKKVNKNLRLTRNQ